MGHKSLRNTVTSGWEFKAKRFIGIKRGGLPHEEADFPAEESCEMAGVGVAHVQRNFYHAPRRLAQQATYLVHLQSSAGGVLAVRHC